MRFLLVTLLLLNAGCHSLSTYRTSEKVTAASTVERDEYEGTTWVQAPLVWYEDSSFKPGLWSKCRLRTLITRAGARTNQLHVLYEHADWAFLDRAHDRRGDRLPTLLLGRNVHASGITEQVAVELTDAHLKDAAIAGLDIKVSGQAGQTVVRLPPHYVQGFLAKLSTIRNEPPLSPPAWNETVTDPTAPSHGARDPGSQERQQADNRRQLPAGEFSVCAWGHFKRPS